MAADVEQWRKSAEEHRDVLEEWAEHDIPLATEVRALLDELDDAEGGGR